MKVGTVICLAVLQRLEESISKKSLRKYLEPLLSTSTFNDAIRDLAERHLTATDGGRIMLVSDWENKVRLWLATHPACIQRHESGDRRRAEESRRNRVRVAKGLLTDAEIAYLRTCPCVIKGCRRKATQIEHFPPKKYLAGLSDMTNQHLVWAICPKHNGKMKHFIRRMTRFGFPEPVQLHLGSAEADPYRIYRAATNRTISEFYAAFDAGDTERAARAVRKMLGLWLAVADPTRVDFTPYPSTPPRTPRTRGRRAYSPSDSQLPYRPPNGPSQPPQHPRQEASPPRQATQTAGTNRPPRSGR